MCIRDSFWDVGLELGHSVRTIDECVVEASSDLTVQTALVEARQITGNNAPVSYTHLDVYKRQLYLTCPAPNTP